MKRVLVTGGSGFVGANLARRLLRDGHEVHLLLRPEHAAWRIKSFQNDVQLHFIDLRDGDRLVTAMAEMRPEWIFHLAAYGAYPAQRDLPTMIETNFVGTVNLVNACVAVGFEAFVNTGSSSEYGFKDHPPSEDEALNPNSEYAVAKASGTLFCRFAALSRNVHLPTLRLYSVYGPFEEPSRLIPALIVSGLRGQLPPLVNPDVARDYVHVDDVCEAYVLAANHLTSEAGALFNVGTGEQTTLRQAVAIARSLMTISAEPCWGSMPNRQWDTQVWVSNSAKITRELGWRPRFTFEQGLRETLEWFRQHPKLREFYEERGSKSNSSRRPAA